MKIKTLLFLEAQRARETVIVMNTDLPPKSVRLRL